MDDSNMQAVKSINATAPNWWRPTETKAFFQEAQWMEALKDNQKPLFVLVDPASLKLGLGMGGELSVSYRQQNPSSFPVRAAIPGLYPGQLGSAEFCRVHGLRFAYVG